MTNHDNPSHDEWTTPGLPRGWRLVGGKRREPRITLQAVVLDLDSYEEDAMTQQNLDKNNA
jgi:hypothetical protein